MEEALCSNISQSVDDHFKYTLDGGKLDRMEEEASEEDNLSNDNVEEDDNDEERDDIQRVVIVEGQ